MSSATADDEVEDSVSECPLCELVTSRPRASDGLVHCLACDMMWREEFVT